MKQQKLRQARVTIFVGKTGTGKTSAIRKILEKMIEKGNHRGLILTKQDDDFVDIPDITKKNKKEIISFKGIARILFYPNCLDEVLSCYRNGVLVLDDARLFVESKPDMELTDFLISGRHLGLDIFASFHTFTDVPRAFYRFATEMFLFVVEEDIKVRKNMLRAKRLKAIEVAQEEIDEDVNRGNKFAYRYISFDDRFDLKTKKEKKDVRIHKKLK